jgi:protein phosphatase
MEMRCYGASTSGRRPENEDVFLHEVYEKPRGCLHALAAVCDGMGGQLGGQTASRLAIEVLKERTDSPPDNQSVEAWIRATVDAIQKALIEKSERNPGLAGMGTTLVFGVITDSGVWIANVGDSRAYRLSNDGVSQLTVDHTAVQDAINRDLYSIEDIRANPSLRQMSSALLRNLGEGGDATVDICEYPLLPGEAFLFCSDGLSGALGCDLITEKDIEQQIRGTLDPRRAVDNLVSIAFQRGSGDNITATILEIGLVERRTERMRDEPDVEFLRRKETERAKRMSRLSKRRKLYRRSVPFLVGAAILLCLWIVLLQWRGLRAIIEEPVEPHDISVDEAAIVPEMPKDGYLVAESEERGKLHWMISVKEELRRDQGVHFIAEDLPEEIHEVNLCACRSSSMENPECSSIKVTKSKKGSYLFTLNETELTDGVWWIELRARIRDEEFRSDPKEIEIVRK